MMKLGTTTFLISISAGRGVADNDNCGAPSGVALTCDNYPMVKCISVHDHSDCADNVESNACTCTPLKTNGADCGNRTGVPFQCSSTDACLVTETSEDCGVNVPTGTCSCVALKISGADCGNVSGNPYQCVSTDSCVVTATNEKCGTDAAAGSCTCVPLKTSGADCGNASGAPYLCVGTDTCAEEGTNADCAHNSLPGTCSCVQVVASGTDCGNENGLPFQCSSEHTCAVTATNADCGAYETPGMCACAPIKQNGQGCGNPNGLPFQCSTTNTCITVDTYPVTACPPNASSVDACRCVVKEKTCSTWGPSGFVLCTNVMEGKMSGSDEGTTLEACRQMCLEDDECNDGTHVTRGDMEICLLMKGDVRCCDNAFWNPQGEESPTTAFRCEGPKVYLTTGTDFCAFDFSQIASSLMTTAIIALSITLVVGCCFGCCCGWWCKARQFRQSLMESKGRFA